MDLTGGRGEYRQSSEGAIAGDGVGLNQGGGGRGRRYWKDVRYILEVENMVMIQVWGGRGKGELNGDFQISSSKLFSKMVQLSKMERVRRDYSSLPSSSWHFLSTYYVLETLQQLLRKRREAVSWVHPDLGLSLIDGHLLSGHMEFRITSVSLGFPILFTQLQPGLIRS